MDLKRMRERAHFRHLARRGDAMLGAQEFWDGILYLSRELIPEDEREISRDLFALIAYSWAVAAGKRGTYDPFDVLRTIRDRAWLGYADTPALIAQVRRDLPRAEVAGRMASYLGTMRKCGALTPPLLSDQRWPDCRWPALDATARTAGGACRRGHGCGFVAAGAHRAWSIASVGVWRSAC